MHVGRSNIISRSRVSVQERRENKNFNLFVLICPSVKCKEMKLECTSRTFSSGVACSS